MKRNYLTIAENIPDREPGERRKSGVLGAFKKTPKKVELLQGKESFGYNPDFKKWFTMIVGDGRRSRYYNEARNREEAIVEKNRLYAEHALNGATYWVKPAKVKTGKTVKNSQNHTKIHTNLVKVRMTLWRYKAYAPDGKCLGTFETKSDALKALKQTPSRKSPTKIADPIPCDFCGEPATYRVDFPGDPWTRRLWHECPMNSFLSLKRRSVLAVKEWNTSGHSGTPSKTGLASPALLTAFKKDFKCAGCGCKISRWRFNTLKSCLPCEKLARAAKAEKQTGGDY